MPTSNFLRIRLLDPDFLYKFTNLMANSADPDQKPTDPILHCLQRQGISWFRRTRVKEKYLVIDNSVINFLISQKKKQTNKKQ